MAYDFPSEAWTQSYQAAINANPEYKKAAKSWTHGPIAFVVQKVPESGLEHDEAFILDLHQGECRSAWNTRDIEAAKRQPFCITAGYAQWKAVINKELDPIRGIMLGKLKLKGKLTVVVRYVKAAQLLVETAADVDTRFFDEKI